MLRRAEADSTNALAWDVVARAWDANARTIEEHAAPVTAALVERLAVRPRDRVLELAAGPGALGATWSSLVGPRGKVVVSDISPAMVAVTARRTASLANVEVAVLDACAIDEPDDAFDAVVCRMGLMLVRDPRRALTECRRVLRRGGRFAASTWADSAQNPWMSCVTTAVAAAGLVRGRLTAEPGDVFSLSDAAQLATLARDAHFEDVDVCEIPVVFRVDDIDAHMNRLFSLAAPSVVPLGAAPPSALDAVRRTAAQLVARFATDEGWVMPGVALVVSGRA